VGQDWSLGQFFGGDRRDFPVLRHIVENLRPAGTALEFGVAEGTSLAIIANHMPGRTIGFDSFLGLPEDWGPYPKGSRACLQPDVPGARIVVGWFADTLPRFDFRAVDPIGLVHLDADLYNSTKTVLEYAGPWLGEGCYIVFDEWHGNPWHSEHEEKAWKDYANSTGVTWDVIGHDQEAWAIRLTEVP
jgi:hypothetical protein